MAVHIHGVTARHVHTDLDDVAGLQVSLDLVCHVALTGYRDLDEDRLIHARLEHDSRTDTSIEGLEGGSNRVVVRTWVPVGRQAVELYLEDEDLEVPAPIALEELAQDSQYEGGVWLPVDIDESRIRPIAVRLNISLPRPLVERIDEYTRAYHMTRSGFLAKAATDAMRPK